jgi:protein-tyrosine phosphatase
VIDLHAHVLPGVDDGPRDMDEALELCRQAVADGVDRICACPHSFGRLHCSKERALEVLGELRGALNREGIPLKVEQGMECMLTPELPSEIAAGRVLTLARSRYLAVELPSGLLPSYAGKVLFEVGLAGMVPLIVHPERSEVIARDPMKLRPLVEQGCLAAVAAASLVGREGSRAGGPLRRRRRVSMLLLKRGLAQAVVSDAHHPSLRPFVLGDALKALRCAGGEGLAASMSRFASMVWADATVDMP